MNQATSRSSLTSITRGGQIFNNFVVMLFQVIKQFFWWLMVFWVAVSASTVYLLVTEEEFSYGSHWWISTIEVNHLGNADNSLRLELLDGTNRRVTWRQIYLNTLMKSYGSQLANKLYIGFFVATIPTIFLAGFLARWMKRKGERIAEDDHVRGMYLGNKMTIIKMVKKIEKNTGFKSMFNLSGVPLPPFQECSGVALLGSPGVGKSTTYRDVMLQLREQKCKALVYDISGEFVRKFYRPGRDIILNPFDKRSASWDVWSEGKNEIAYDRIAQAAIPPDAKADPFWTKAPQLVLASLIDKVARSSVAPTMADLMHLILHVPDEYMARIVAGTDAASILNMNVEKLAGSLRSIISTNVRSFKFMHARGESFSFKQWAREDSDRWVFITVRDDLKATMTSLTSVWIEMALSAILSAETNEAKQTPYYRIGTLIDEVATLNPLPSLIDYVSTCRKFGGFPVFGIQSNSQGLALYGKDRFTAFTDSIGTIMAFRMNGSDGAQWASQQLGKEEQEQTTENASYGAASVRDAVNVNKQRKSQEVIMSGEIMQLPDYECYLRLGRGMPLVKLKIDNVKLPDVQPAFIETDDLDDFVPMDTSSMYDPSSGGGVDGLINHIIEQSNANHDLMEDEGPARDHDEPQQPKAPDDAFDYTRI